MFLKEVLDPFDDPEMSKADKIALLDQQIQGVIERHTALAFKMSNMDGVISGSVPPVIADQYEPSKGLSKWHFKKASPDIEKLRKLDNKVLKTVEHLNRLQDALTKLKRQA